MTYDSRVFLCWGGYLGTILVFCHLVNLPLEGDQTGFQAHVVGLIGSANQITNVAFLFLLGFLMGGSVMLLVRWQTPRWLSKLSNDRKYSMGFLGGKGSRLTRLYFRHGLGIDDDGTLLD